DRLFRIPLGPTVDGQWRGGVFLPVVAFGAVEDKVGGDEDQPRLGPRGQLRQQRGATDVYLLGPVGLAVALGPIGHPRGMDDRGGPGLAKGGDDSVAIREIDGYDGKALQVPRARPAPSSDV